MKFLRVLTILMAGWCAASGLRADTGPMHWGLSGLSETVAVPERIAPIRLGTHYRFGSVDPGHGFAASDSLFGSAVRSHELRLTLSLMASESVYFSAALPYRFWTSELSSADGIGDLETAVATRIFDARRFELGLFGMLRAPTGQKSRGLSTGQVEGEFGLSGTLVWMGDGVVPETRWFNNVGWRVNKGETEGYGLAKPDVSIEDTGVWPPVYAASRDDEPNSNDQLLVRSAVEFRRRWGHIFMELSGDFFVGLDDIRFAESPTWFTPGIYIATKNDIGLKVAASIGLWADDSETEFVPPYPDWFVSASISKGLYWGGRDRDLDGIPDKEDGCPDMPEDIDGHADDDGCPDEDNDGDGIPDRHDRAPNLAEDFDGFEDEDGRPDADNDFDGIVDTEDQCPNQPEDFDGFQDEDGCPDIVVDADGDGIEDLDDDCPRQAEDVDGFEDDDGCPEEDNDLDGIPDAEDECPNEKEDYDGVDDDDGCPEPS